MSIQEAAAAAVARWSGRTIGGMDLPTVMVAIAGAESGWRNDASGDRLGSVYNCGGYSSWGLWQINMSAHHAYLERITGSSNPCTWATWLSDPANCARAASVLFGEADTYPMSALRPWTVWWSPDGNPANDAGDGNGMWRRHFEDAKAAVAAVQQPPAAPPGPQPGQIGNVDFVRTGVTVGFILIGLLVVAAVAGGMLEMEQADEAS